MKKIKQILAMILTLTMTIPMISFSNEAHLKAATTFAITSPTANQLVAAGYIDIEWEPAIKGTISSYEVYIDGSKVTTTTNTSYEYYTTKVQVFEVNVKANYTNGTSETTETITFGVSKKGLGLAQDMGANISLRDMGVAWYYNWGETPNSGEQYVGIEYVPMVWKETNASNFKTRVEKAKSSGYKYILTFNEPDLAGQCDMPVNDVYNVWQGIEDMEGIRISSPVTAQWPSNSQEWFQVFMTQVDENNDYKPDFISIHCYPDNYGGAEMAEWFLEEVVDWTWETYQIPIWITEFSTVGDSITATGDNGTKEFWETVMPGLDSREYVERYAAFCINSATTGLWLYSTGELTPGGQVYAQLGNPTSYEPCKVVFKNEGQAVDTQIVDYGTAAVAPTLQKEGYTLSWDKSFDNVTEDLEINAVWTINEYDVVFKNGEQIEKTQTVEYGSAAQPPELEKEGHTLSWDKSFDNVTEDLEVNAVWTPIEYNVVFKDDNKVISTQKIAYGDSATAPVLEKEGYTLGWDKSFENITGELEINAIWNLNKYNVIFKDGNLVLKEQEVFHGYGAIAPEVAKEGYILSWDKSFGEITGNLEVNAVWTKEPCQVVFKNEGQVVDTQTVDYGTAAVAPTLQKEGYTLSWDKSFDNVTEDLEINAVWTINSYKVIFKDGDLAIKEQEVYHGYAAIAPELAKSGYTLSWDKSFDNVTEDLEVNAVWTPKEVETTTVEEKPIETTTVKEEKPTETTKVNNETTTSKVKLAKTKIKKATKKKASKKAKISLKKIKGATGYEVQISKKKNFKTILIKKKVKKVSFSISSKRIKKLKKIYVRARAFVKKNGKTSYGAWSKAKRIKIK